MVSAQAGSKPDMLILNREQRTVALLDLTCPLPSSSHKAHIRKINTYTQLCIDLEDRGLKIFLVPFGVLSSGHINNQCKISNQKTLQQFNIRVKNSLFFDSTKMSPLCPMSVFYAYHEKEWVSPPLLSLWPTLTWPHCGHPSWSGLFHSQTVDLFVDTSLSTLGILIYLPVCPLFVTNKVVQPPLRF